MSAKLYEWLRRIKTVELEHSATRLAMDRLMVAAGQDSTVLTPKLPLRAIRMASERLEGTFLVRLFAEFETGLRQFWPTARNTHAPSRTRDLLDGIAATRRIPHEQLTNAHLVREYRNRLIHAREEPVDAIPIAGARGHLCQLFSFLPPDW